MPSHILTPLLALVAVVVAVYAFAPIVWLTRSERALALRRMSGRKLLAWWCAATIPWIIVLLAVHFYQRISFSASGVLELLVAILVALALVSVLVSLPLAVIVLSVMWKLDRNSVVSLRTE
ncbi:MAG: hypothetical protein ABI035_07625 [Gemmatimonadaceae bacterium]